MGAKFGDKTECKNGCPDQLAAKGEDQNGPNQLIDVHRITGGVFRRELQFAQAQLPAGEESKARCEGNHTQAAGLDQEDNHNLPEHVPVGPGVKCDQAGYAGRGGRGKQRVDHGGELPAAACDGERQKRCTDHDHNKKADDNQSDGGGTDFRRLNKEKLSCNSITSK